MTATIRERLFHRVEVAENHGISRADRNKLQSKISKAGHLHEIGDAEMRSLSSRLWKAPLLGKLLAVPKIKIKKRPGSNLPERRQHERPEPHRGMTVANVLALSRMRRNSGFSEV